MAGLADLPSGKVYLDTNVFIYAVEAVPEYAVAVEALFGRIDDRSVVAVTSELTLGEVLAKPFEAGRYDIVVPVERTILIQAARLQSQLVLRLPDAIHVATAAIAGCSAVLSNDRRLRVPADIKLHRLP